MFQRTLEEAGLHLVQLRRELKDAEARFRSQYEEAKRSVEKHHQEIRSRLDEGEQQAREQLAQSLGAYDGASGQSAPLLRGLTQAMESMRANVQDDEERSRVSLEKAERILADKS